MKLDSWDKARAEKKVAHDAAISDLEKKIEDLENNKTSPGAALAAILIALFALGTGAMLAGGVVQCLWLWFIVPLGLPVIGLWHAVGIDVLVTFVTSNIEFKKEPDIDVDYIKSILKKLYVRPVIILAMGWAAAWLMGGVL